MVFATGDQKRIADALRLTREQYFASSCLATLMSELEAVDIAQSTTFVADIQEALDDIDCLDEEIESAVESDGIASESVDNQYSVTYRGAGGASSSSKHKRAGLIDNIKLWLDPDNKLDAYSTGSRVIMTL